MAARQTRRVSARPPPSHPVPLSRPRDPFVGREPELERLREAVGRTIAGYGCIRLIFGEPGIGKTRLAEEVAAEAALEGMRELRGRCNEAGGAPPYWPWMQAIRPLLAGSTEKEIAADWGTGARIARTLFPEYVARIPEQETHRRTPGSDEVLWFRLLDALSAYLLRASRRQPLFVILDDLHWADQRSLDLLLHLTRQIADHPVFLLGTIRQTGLDRSQSLVSVLGELVKEPAYDELSLEGLTRAEVELYLGCLLGDGIPKRLSRSVHRLTDGNPLYLSQIARNPAALEGRSGPLPEGVHSAIASRLAALSSHTYDVLAAASLFAGGFRLDQLALVLQVTAESVAAAVDEASRAHILRANPLEPQLHDFVHGLIRDCLRADLPLDRKTALHAAIADMLERSYGLDAGVPAAELVMHFAAARPLVSAGKVARFARDAARQALEHDAWEDSIRYTDLGLGALEGEPMDDLKAELIAVRTIALNVASGLQLPYEASEPLAQAFEQYERSGNAPLAMEVIRRVGAWLVARYGPSFRDRALRFAPPASADAARVVYVLALGLGNFLGDYAGACAAFQEALAIAEGCADLELQTWVLWFRAGVEHNHLELDRSVGTASRELGLAVENKDPRAMIRAHLQLATWLLPLGRGDEAHAHARRALEVTDALADRHALLSVRSCGAWLAFHDGKLEEALRLGELWLADAPPVGSYWWHPRHLRLRVELESGRFKEARGHLAELIDWVRGTRPGWDAQARLLGCQSIVEAALVSGDAGELATLRRWAGPVPSIPANPYAKQVAMSVQAHLALLSEDRDLAAEQYAALGSQRPAVDLPRLRIVRGALARMLGKLDEAVDQLRSARATLRWSLPSLVQCSHELAATLSLRAAPGDLHEARVVWTEGLELAERHGLELWCERIREGLRSLERQTGKRGPARFPDGLTVREAEVLRLLASGKTNKTIGWELGISQRTVEQHVGSILGKTRLANRTEAANYARRNGLV